MSQGTSNQAKTRYQKKCHHEGRASSNGSVDLADAGVAEGWTGWAALSAMGYLPTNGNGNGQRGGQSGNGNGQSQAENGDWNCSGKQKDLILKIVEEHKLEKAKVETLAQDRFGKTVKALNKLEASGLIEELLEMTGQSKGRSRFQGRYQRAGGR